MCVCVCPIVPAVMPTYADVRSLDQKGLDHSKAVGAAAAEGVEAVKVALEALTPANSTLICALMQLFEKIVLVPANKMEVANLGTSVGSVENKCPPVCQPEYRCISYACVRARACARVYVRVRVCACMRVCVYTTLGVSGYARG